MFIVGFIWLRGTELWMFSGFREWISMKALFAFCWLLSCNHDDLKISVIAFLSLKNNCTGALSSSNGVEQGWVFFVTEHCDFIPCGFLKSG